MIFIKLIDNLNDFAKENTFLSLIILAIIGNLATDLVKNVFINLIYRNSIRLISKGRKAISNSAKNNINFLIRHYENNLASVESIKNQNKTVIIKLLEDVYFNLSLLLILVVILLIIYKVSNPTMFYGLLGGGAITLFRLIYNSVHTMSLFRQARNYEQYRITITKKISSLKSALGNS